VQIGDRSYSACDVFAYLYTFGVATVVITNGKDGIYASDGSTLYYHPALPAEEIVNTVGAGDAFGSACCAALLEKHTLREALIYGLCNSRGVISKLDAKSGILDKQELKIHAKAIGMQFLQTFLW